MQTYYNIIINVSRIFVIREHVFMVIYVGYISNKLLMGFALLRPLTPLHTLLANLAEAILFHSKRG